MVGRCSRPISQEATGKFSPRCVLVCSTSASVAIRCPSSCPEGLVIITLSENGFVFPKSGSGSGRLGLDAPLPQAAASAGMLIGGIEREGEIGGRNSRQRHPPPRRHAIELQDGLK